MTHDNKEEILPQVNKEGIVIGSVNRGHAHDGSKILHPVVHLHLFDPEGRLFLQLRPIWKTVQPGKWDTSCGGHIAYGEDVEEALRREVQEELGIENIEPKEVARYVFESPIESEYVYVFRSVYTGEVHPSQEELTGGRFFTQKEIAERMGKDIFTPNFEQEYKKYFTE